jgi:hypothetical protein
MEQCTSCGATISAQAQWCDQCFAPRARVGAMTGLFAAPPAAGSDQARPDQTAQGTPAMARVPVAVGMRPTPAPPVLPPTVVRSRWRKTQTTFGPLGRVIATVCLVVPFLVMLVGGLVGDVFALGGAGIWLIVIMPWGLRDVWKAGQVAASS